MGRARAECSQPELIERHVERDQSVLRRVQNKFMP